MVTCLAHVTEGPGTQSSKRSQEETPDIQGVSVGEAFAVSSPCRNVGFANATKQVFLELPMTGGRTFILYDSICLDFK